MKFSIIGLGTELVSGRTINSNATFIAKELVKIGHQVIRILNVADLRDDMVSAFEYCKNDSDMVISTGGLGPTNDDVTRQTVCEYFHCRLVRNHDEYQRIMELLASRGLTSNSFNQAQADYPDSANLLTNRIGTASGFILSKDSCEFVFLPGVPQEMKHITIEQLIPYILKNKAHEQPRRQDIFRFIRYPESQLYSDIYDIIHSNPELDFAFYPNYLTVDLIIKGISNNNQSILNEIEIKTKSKAYAKTDETDIIDVIQSRMISKKYSLAIAESCTGGLLSSQITSKSGSSAYFVGASVCYSNQIKQLELGLAQDIIIKYGAVSEEAVRLLAENIRKIYKTKLGISISGIAGPEGGTDEKPVGTVWIGFATENGTITEKFQLGKQRDLVQQRACQMALYLLWNYLKTTD